MHRLQDVIDTNHLLKDELDVYDFIEEDQLVDGTIENFDDLYTAIDNHSGFDAEIIYHSNAMEFLTEQDPSLMLSLEIAVEMGFKMETLNSERLASLLQSQMIRKAFNSLENEINAVFDEYREEKEAENEQ